MLENGIALHPKYKGQDGYSFLNCTECGCEEETIVIPDPITIKYDLDLVHCFLCHAHYYYSVEYCLRCESADYSLEFLDGYDETSYPETSNKTFNINNFDDEDKYVLCELCQEDIEDE